jgi:hypothetical protein
MTAAAPAQHWQQQLLVHGWSDGMAQRLLGAARAAYASGGDAPDHWSTWDHLRAAGWQPRHPTPRPQALAARLAAHDPTLSWGSLAQLAGTLDLCYAVVPIQTPRLPPLRLLPDEPALARLIDAVWAPWRCATTPADASRCARASLHNVQRAMARVVDGLGLSVCARACGRHPATLHRYLARGVDDPQRHPRLGQIALTATLATMLHGRLVLVPRRFL